MLTYDIRDLAERLLGEDFLGVRLTLHEVDRDEFERNVLLKQSEENSLGAGRDVCSV